MKTKWVLAIVVVVIVLIVLPTFLTWRYPLIPKPETEKPSVSHTLDPLPPVEQPKPPKPIFVSKVTEKDGKWIITLNKAAVEAVKNQDVRVRLNIGYCTYESDVVNGNTVEIKPDWHPSLDESRITAGLWKRIGSSEGRYLSSVVVKNAQPETKPEIQPEIQPVVKEIQQPEVKVEIKPLPPPSEMTPDEVAKRLERYAEPKVKDDISKSLELLQEVWK